MRYNLSGAHWTLKGFDPYVPIMGKSMELQQDLRGITPKMDCQVPGGVALAAYRAGLIEHPYFELNSLKCEWLANRWWIYETAIPRPDLRGTKYKLVFHGVDYSAMVYLNGVLLGEHEGMYERFSFDITNQFLESDTLAIRVLLKHAPDEMGQIGMTSMTHTQKSRFNYKWDFSTRLVNLGIWQDVELVAESDFVLEDLALSSDVEDGTGLLHISGTAAANGEEVSGLAVSVSCGLRGKEVAACRLEVKEWAFSGTLCIENPALWYPNGYGAQPLYDVTLTLRAGETVYDTRAYKQGIRRLRYLQNEDAPAGALPYTFEINGEKIYIKGVNMTPLDHIYGDVSPERYEATLRAVANMNVNLIRVWGGGLIEKKCFYDLCDRYGLMVWQEFIQSSSGIDNIPSKRPEFLRLLAGTARCALKKRRNHTSLAVWSGGNELMDKDGIPSTYADENIAMLKKMVGELNPGRMFLPTSASGPSEWQLNEPGKSHDIHGDWKYRGNPRHYESYAESDNLLHSEFGCDGMSGMRTAPKIFSEARQRPVGMDSDAVWRFHGDWWCTYERDTGLFGPLETMEAYVAASQWIQAEGLRFILEANRRRQFRNSGSMIWQFNEPWPNISGTCLYSYYDEPKMAYYWAKQAFSPYHVSLDYRRLNFTAGSRFTGRVWLCSDWTVKETTARIRCEALGMDGRVLARQEQDCAIRPGGSTSCFTVAFTVPQMEEALFALRVTAESGAYRDENCYFFSTAKDTIYAPARRLPAAALETALVYRQGNERTYRVKNTGKVAALHIQVHEAADRHNILADCNFFTLFPSESREVRVQSFPKFSYGFDEYAGALPGGEPDIRFAAFPTANP